MRYGLTLALVTLLALVATAQKAAQYGVITHGNVQARAGTADYDADVATLDRGDVVRVVGKDGDWYSVLIPGGVEAFVKSGVSGRAYVKVADNGEGLVLVDRLQLRPKPTTDWPSMGVLAPNTRVVILGEEPDSWYRIVAPAGHAVFVYADYLDVPTVQDGLAAKFAMADEKRRVEVLEASPLARKGLEASRQNQEMEAAYAELERRLDRALAARAGAAELREIRMKYENLASFAPSGSEIAHRARDRAAYVQGREGVATEIDDAETRIRNLERDLASSEDRYAGDLEKFRTERRESGEASAAAVGKSADPEGATGRFLRYGIGHVHKDLLTSTSSVDHFILSKGSEQRFQMISHRYDLAEYYGKRIGIVKWEKLKNARGELPRIEVIRLEVLE